MVQVQINLPIDLDKELYRYMGDQGIKGKANAIINILIMAIGGKTNEKNKKNKGSKF